MGELGQPAATDNTENDLSESNADSPGSLSTWKQRVLLSLGRKHPTDELWTQAPFIKRMIQFEHAAPSGYRFNSRIFGLGIDSILLALKASFVRGDLLVTNPWIGIATKLLGRQEVAVIGIYATPGSRAFRALRRILGNSIVITTVDIEADAWRGAGGTAGSVLYGNTFGYPARRSAGRAALRIFVGGSSDRDSEMLARLETEIRTSAESVSLVVVTGGADAVWNSGEASIRHISYVPSDTFGKLIAESNVVFLPLQQTGRAAGHMVTVGALECGVPVVTTPSDGMSGYVDGHLVVELDTRQPLLPQLRQQQLSFEERGDEVRKAWLDGFSRGAFIRRVGAAIADLEHARALRRD